MINAERVCSTGVAATELDALKGDFSNWAEPRSRDVERVARAAVFRSGEGDARGCWPREVGASARCGENGDTCEEVPRADAGRAETSCALFGVKLDPTLTSGVGNESALVLASVMRYAKGEGLVGLRLGTNGSRDTEAEEERRSSSDVLSRVPVLNGDDSMVGLRGEALRAVAVVPRVTAGNIG